MATWLVASNASLPSEAIFGALLGLGVGNVTFQPMVDRVPGGFKAAEGHAAGRCSMLKLETWGGEAPTRPPPSHRLEYM